MQSPSKKIIEICGLPGSGKTTIARKLAQRKDITRVLLTTKVRISGYFLRGFFTHPIYFLNGLLFALRNVGSFSEFWNSYVYRYARYTKAVCAKEKICILDEGPVQSIYSYAVSGLNPALLDKYLDIVPKSTTTLVLSIPEVDRYSQLEKRRATRVNDTQPQSRNYEPNLDLAEKILTDRVAVCGQFVGIATEIEAERAIETRVDALSHNQTVTYD